MSGGTLCKVSVGRNGGASNNALYITRASAVTDGVNGVLIRHLQEVIDSRDFAGLRTDVSSYFWAREEVELALEGKNASVGKCGKVQSGKVRVKERQTRTHYRVILSFENEVGTEKAKAMVNEWLEKTPFKDAPAVAAIHRDTDHPHAHILIDACQVSGKKVELSPREFRTLDEVWNEIYCREFGLDETEHLAKKAEMREYKRAILKAKRQGKPLPERPTRSTFPERDKFASREARENKSIAADETWNAGRRFDRGVRRIERRIKSQFDVRYQLKRQLNPLIQIEGRVQALRRLGELVYDAGKGLHDAYQRRIAVRESISQGGPGDTAEAGATSGAGARADSSREGASRSAGRAITTEAEPITTAGGIGLPESAAPQDVAGTYQAEDPRGARGTVGDDARTGQERGQGGIKLGGGESDNTKFRNKGTQSGQELTSSAGEDNHAPRHLPLSGPPRTTGSERVRVDHSGEECDSREGVGLGQRGESQRTTRAVEARGRANGRETSSSLGDILGNNLSDSWAGNVTWAEEIHDPVVVDDGISPMRTEPQALPFGCTLGDGMERGIQLHPSFDESGYMRGAPITSDMVESGTASTWREPSGGEQESSSINPMGADDSLRPEWSVDEKYLQSNLLDPDLRDRLVASNDALLETINKDVLAQTNETAAQVIETEAESVEVTDSAPIIDFFL